MRQSSPAKPRRTAGADAVSAVRRRMVRTVLVLVLVLAVADGVFGERGLLANIDVRQRIAAKQSSIDEMTTRNDTLTEEIRRLREEPSAVEELAREELGLIKDGELLIILRDTPTTTAQPPQRASTSR
jgi:cell division protein FtsB